MTPILLSLLLSQNPAFVGPYTRLGSQNPSALMDAGSVLRGALIFATDGGAGEPRVYDGRNWSGVLSATTAPMNLYVNGDGGSNANDCGSSTTACATIQAAVDRIPYWVRHDVTVTVEPIWNPDGGAAGIYTEDIHIAGHRIGPEGSLGTSYPTITVQGSDTWTTITTGTATSFTDVSGITEGSLVDNTKAWSPVAYEGRFVQMTSGTGNGTRRLITSNDATTLGLNRAGLGAGIGDTFSVVSPSTVLLGSITVENITGAVDAQKGGVVLKRMAVATTDGPSIVGRNLVKPALTTHVAYTFDTYRPRATLVLDEMYVVSTASAKVAFQCDEAACGLRSASLTGNAERVVDVRHGTFDLGFGLIRGSREDGVGLYTDSSTVVGTIYPNYSAVTEWSSYVEGFPVIDVLGNTSKAWWAVNNTKSNLHILLLRAGDNAPVNPACLFVDSSSIAVTTLTCEAWGRYSGYTPAVGVYGGNSDLYVYTLDVSEAYYGVWLEFSAHLRVGPTPTATAGATDGGTFDLTLDTTTTTDFASVGALTPSYVTGTQASYYSQN